MCFDEDIFGPWESFMDRGMSVSRRPELGGWFPTARDASKPVQRLGLLDRNRSLSDESGNGTRQASENLVTQFNPTYTAAGNRPSITDLLNGVSLRFTYEYGGLNRLMQKSLVSVAKPDRNYVMFKLTGRMRKI